MKHFEDNFAQDLLPEVCLMPEFLEENFHFKYPDFTNCSYFLLDKHIQNGDGNRIAVRSNNLVWTYQELNNISCQIAHVLVDDLKLKTGNRVLIRSTNNPMFVAVWLAVIKAGGIVISTMPLLREKELSEMIETAKVDFAICDYSLSNELVTIKNETFNKIITFNGSNQNTIDLDSLILNKPIFFDSFKAHSEAIAIIGFTSGTTGKPKLTAHYHKDIIAICEAFPKFALQPQPTDIFTGTPPLGFTFGLGGLVLFPLYYGASTFLIEKPTPELLLETIQNHKITICFTAPTAWRILCGMVSNYDVNSLRKCISAGETLPLKIWQDWYDLTGLKIIDGIGSTELLHIFISSKESNMKPGCTGIAIDGYKAKIIDQYGNDLAPNIPGRLAVKGITGCKYLNAGNKQQEYVQNGWNITGDIFKQDEDGYFTFVARGDDMIISSGYNIAAIEVENILLSHEDIKECAVVGVADDQRGMIVCAYLVTNGLQEKNNSYKEEIQNWFKANAAPYKYPRIINFVDELPKTETGKIQRFKLKNKA